MTSATPPQQPSEEQPSGQLTEEPLTEEPLTEEPLLTVAAVARRLGVAPATLRTWDRRYGLGPAGGHEPGRRRRYSAADLATLERMRALVLSGVTSADAARLAVQAPATPAAAHPTAGATPEPAAAGAGTPAATRATTPASTPATTPAATPAAARAEARAEIRGVSRAAHALDSAAVRQTLERRLESAGPVGTWESVLRPVLQAVGERWARTGQGEEVEHLLSECAAQVLRPREEAPDPPGGRPVLLACAPGEQHTLPLHALAAVLAEHGVGTRQLGGRTPIGALTASVRRVGPAVLVVYAHLPADGLMEVLEAIPDTRPPVAVLAAGPGWPSGPLPAGARHVDSLQSACDAVLEHLAQAAPG